MRAGPIILWIAVIAVGAPAIALSARAASVARRSASTRIERFRTLAGQAAALADLRARRPAWSAQAPRGGEAALAQSVSAVLASCGLTPASLASLSPESETTLNVGDLKVERQRATVTLAQITLPELGGFLDAWRRREPAWVCSSIEVTPESGKKPAPGADLPLRAILAVETLRLRTGGER